MVLFLNFLLVCVSWLNFNPSSGFDKKFIVEIRIEDVFTRYINLPDQEREQYVFLKLKKLLDVNSPINFFKFFIFIIRQLILFYYGFFG